jgi:hypothetical protein
MSGHHSTLIPSLLRGMIGHPQDEYDVKLIKEAADKFAALIAERDALRTENKLLRGMIDLVMAIPNMSNEQLEQLKANCRIALSAEKGE